VRALGLKGWLSSNISGNCDGYELDHPDIFKQLIRLHNQLRQLMREDLLSPLSPDK
jgi:hypothetical protein